jgi:hypothetical protein
MEAYKKPLIQSRIEDVIVEIILINYRGVYIAIVKFRYGAPHTAVIPVRNVSFYLATIPACFGGR